MKARVKFLCRSAGFSLVELLVAMAIGLIATLAITTVLLRSEGSKRSTTSVNDLNQTGAFTAYVLDRALRNAGTGFTQNWSTTYGCLLNASRSSVQMLPIVALPSTSAFANVTAAAMPVRLAPVVIGKGLAPGTGGDVLMVMSGTGGASELPLTVTPGSVGLSQLMVANTLGYKANDVILLVDSAVPGGCLVEQIGPTLGATPQVVPLAGTYYTATGSTSNLLSFGSSTLMAHLGTDGSNPPQFQLFGVGENNTLFSYDLLQASEQAVADGVVEMRAIYGLDTGTPPNGRINAWVDPVAGSGYEASVLLNGSAVSRTRLRQIVAVRVGFFMRTALEERSPVASGTGVAAEGYSQATGTTLTLFDDAVNSSGVSLRQTRTLTGTDLNFRFRTTEVTVPLLNVLNAPQL